MMTQQTYDQKTIRLHWISAALIMTLWVLGQTIDWFPKVDPRVMARSAHICLGAILALVLIRRIVWRRTRGVKLPQAIPGLMGRLAIGVHHLLYLLLTCTVAIGIAAVWIRGDNLFNLFTVPAFDPANQALRHNVVELHGLLANALLILAGLHALAALWHHFVLKDGTLKRMWR